MMGVLWMPLLAVLFVGVSASLLFLGLAWIYGIAGLVLLAVPLLAIAVHYADNVNRRTWLRRWWYRVTLGPLAGIGMFGWILGGVPDSAPGWLRALAAAWLHQWHLPGSVRASWATAPSVMGNRGLYAWFASMEVVGCLIGLEIALDILDIILRAVLRGDGFDPATAKSSEVEAGKVGTADDPAA